MPLTHNQRAILEAIEQGHTTIRALAKQTGHSSSTIHSNLRRLEAGGHLALRRNGRHTSVEAGADFASGWDLACRLAGNMDA
jgi:predicted transcriptional regulator